MVRGPASEVIEAIRISASIDHQIAALKQLKNDIVGHEQRKELVVKQGVVEPLVSILSIASKATGKRPQGNGNEAGVQLSPQWTNEDEARLQATLIVGSLAGAGKQFVQPLLAAGVPKQLLAGLGADTSTRLVTATLQALRSLASSAYEGGESREQIQLGIFDRTVEPFPALLHQPTTTSAGKQQLKLTADIITLSATDESTRSMLSNAGILDNLTSLLVSHAITNKYFEYSGQTPYSTPCPPSAAIPSILSAITALITGSDFRVQSFCLSPVIRELFANISDPSTDRRYGSVSRHGGQNATDSLLPTLHVPTYKSVSFNGGSSAFPALSSLQSAADRRPGTVFDASQYADAEHSNTVCGWLIILARSMIGLSRLIALRLLALVNNAIEADSGLVSSRSESLQRAREREKQMAMLAIPLAVRLVQMAGEGKEQNSPNAERESQEVKEQSSEVLALLIQGNKELQAAAIDAGAIKRVCPLLKKSFDNVTIAKPMWSPRSSTAAGQMESSASCRLGSKGLPAEVQHAMRCRQSALEALSALAANEDVHRKAIVEAGVVSCIIDSLKPFPADFFTKLAETKGQLAPKDGNTIPVILAACHAAKAMSRSVSLLRTSLIDAGIAKPVFDLLKHLDPEVQIAATDVCCNLLLEFSPMREDLLAAGAIKTLTQHARQSEMRLRLASLWALKHLVLSSTKEIKIQCLEELGTGWLVTAIQGEHRESAFLPASGGVSIGPAGGLSTPNAAGEQVDLLNPPTSMDVDEPTQEDEELDEDEDEDGEVMYDEGSKTHYQSSQLRSTLQSSSTTSSTFHTRRHLESVREREQNPAFQAERNDVLVQEQALDFIRNMLNGEDCAYMFEHLLEQVGVDKIFGLLNEKLAPVGTTPATINAAAGSSSGGRSTSSVQSNRNIYHPTDLILSTIHVLTHIANGSPKHKQLLIAQTTLLRNWLPHFTHLDRRVRVISVWAVNSLTWVEDDTDRPDAQKRARVLREAGIEGAIRGLVNDPDLDVRERVRTAVRQIEGL